MTQDLEWRKCAHCAKDRFCSAVSMREHEEDCNKRPTKIAKQRLCPMCGSVLEKVLPGSWICVSPTCDFTVDVLPGGKVT